MWHGLIRNTIYVKWTNFDLKITPGFGIYGNSPFLHDESLLKNIQNEFNHQLD